MDDVIGLIVIEELFKIFEICLWVFGKFIYKVVVLEGNLDFV